MLTSDMIEQSLAKVRPFLAVDGGDVQLVGLKENGIVEVRYLGACVSCPMSMMTLRAGIERALMLEHREVTRVEQVK
jgi:Fe-S cluster biogenesis protein NfuA